MSTSMRIYRLLFSLFLVSCAPNLWSGQAKPASAEIPSAAPISSPLALHGLKLEFVRLPPGEFVMGSNERPNEQPPHRVVVSSFDLAVTEVTVRQFHAFVQATAYQTDAERALLWVLRTDLQLTGAKYGCGIGECSACTVQMDGQPALACLILAVSAAGHDILTVEGLQKPDGKLDPLQEAFLDFAALCLQPATQNRTFR